MSVEVTIPEAGESISEVEIGRWHKADGDSVDQDEIVVEIETDKASMDLPAPAAGTLRILKQAGQTVSVGDVIAEIETDGRAETSGTKGAERGAETKEPDKPAQREKTKAKQPPDEKPAGKAAEKDRPKPSTEKARPERRQRRTEPEKSETAAEDSRERGQEGAEPSPAQVEVRPRVMPAARRALAEHGLTPDDVEATGPGGRILKEDVLRRAEQGGPDDGERARTAGAPQATVAEPTGPREEEVVPMTPLRRRIATRLVEAQQTAALLTTFNEIDMSEVKALRKRFGEAFESKHGVRLGFMSLFVKASIEALKRVPQVNAEIRDSDIVYRNYYDIGVAVATDHGLVVPVLRNAEQMSVAETERAISDLARRARERKITIEELQGGTFTISNGGVYGSLLSTPIVNPPQSGILGLHAIQDRPVARDGQVVVRPMMYVALTYDHRLVDGREAVTFLRHVKELIESPARMLLEA